LQSLPIDALLPSLTQTLQQHENIVLQAPPGAGKTTRVPGALLDAGFAAEGAIWVVEPRRLAARSAATRVAQERAVSLGREVGYHVRFEHKASTQTRILFLTEGMLLRRLQDDPFLEDVAVVVFDEFHERRLSTDLALALLRQCQQEIRPELKLLVMSATLDTEAIAAYLDDCPVLTSEGRMFPVEIRYEPQDNRTRLPDACVKAIRSVLPETEGHCLVFLPGQGEIRQTEQKLEEIGLEDVDVFPLYGSLPLKEQDAVLRPSRRRKIVLATNIAETSLTIDGVTTVVDSGFERQMQWDARSGLNRLVTTRISQASAEQRKGRAGRQQEGVCIRLWDRHQHRHLLPQTPAEIVRVDCTEACLQLLAWGETDLTAFGWLEPPPAASLQRSLALLRRLGAVEDKGVTPLGQKMSELPLHPRLARLCLEGCALGIKSRVALLAALLSEKDPFRRDDPTQPQEVPLFSDVVARLDALEQIERKGWTRFSFGRVQTRLLRSIHKASAQILRQLPSHQPRSLPLEEAIGKALLAAYPDRLAKRRGQRSERARMVGGRGVKLTHHSAVFEPPLFLCLSLEDGQGGERSEARVFLASGIKQEWLPESALHRNIHVVFDKGTEKVKATEQRLFEDLVLEENTAPLPKGGEVEEALATAASQHWERAFDWNDRALKQWLERVAFLRHWMPELVLPAMAKAAITPMLPALCGGKRSFAELRKMPLLSALQAQLTWAQQQAIEEYAPERLQVPSGSRIRLEYKGTEPPVLAVRIQEVFGWADTPRLARNKVPVLLHLLAPNQRPQQVTQDLRNFWEQTYHEVRKELRQRYPKHSWPEDPWNAQAMRGAKRRKK
jgi:ATP-dependent helicase HrpB